MSLLTIDHQKCTSDGLCAANCPIGIITMNAHGPEPIPGAEQMCLNCGHCVAVCPHGALTLHSMPLENCPPLQKDWQLQPEQVAQFLKGRRSVRSYTSESVPRELLEKIIDVTRFAQTGKNSQTLHWTIIRDSQEIHRIAEATIEWMREIVQRPQMAWAKALVAAWENGYDPICRSAPHLIFTHVPESQAQMAAIDGAIALTYMALAALPYQLGTCWTGFVMMAAAMSPSVQAALNLPEGHKLLGGMMLGYPKVKYHRIPMRNAARVVWR